MSAEEFLPHQLSPDRHYVVCVLLQIRYLRITFYLETGSFKRRGENRLVEQSQRAVDVSRQHFGRQAQAVVTREGRKRSADFLDELRDLSSAAFACVLRQERRQQARRSALSGRFVAPHQDRAGASECSANAARAAKAGARRWAV